MQPTIPVPVAWVHFLASNPHSVQKFCTRVIALGEGLDALLTDNIPKTAPPVAAPPPPPPVTPPVVVYDDEEEEEDDSGPVTPAPPAARPSLPPYSDFHRALILRMKEFLPGAVKPHPAQSQALVDLAWSSGDTVQQIADNYVAYMVDLGGMFNRENAKLGLSSAPTHHVAALLGWVRKRNYAALKAEAEGMVEAWDDADQRKAEKVALVEAPPPPPPPPPLAGAANLAKLAEERRAALAAKRDAILGGN